MHEQYAIGVREAWGQDILATLPVATRTRHLYAVGQTGTGKSTLLLTLLAQDALAGRGFALLDPHGETARTALFLIPKRRTDHTCYLALYDEARPVAFNPLEDARDPALRPLVVDAIVSAMRSVWRDSWGPRMEYILTNALSALAELPDATLLGVVRLLTDDRWREQVAWRLRDPVVRHFWQEEYAAWDRRFRTEAAAPVLNKVGALFLSPAVRSVLAQPTSTFSPLFAIQHRRILLADLDKGRVGEVPSSLVGSLLLSSFLFAAMRRGVSREVFLLYADEFHTFATDAFATVLSEARKYGLGLALFHQYGAQVPEPVLAAVYGNAGTMVALRVGADDARRLSEAFAGAYPPERFMDLEPYHALVRLAGEQPYRVRLFPPPQPLHAKAVNILQQSRMRFGRPRARVQAAVLRQLRTREPPSRRA